MLRSFVFFSCCLVWLTAHGGEASLEVRVTNIEDASGTLVVTVYADPDNWLKKEYFRNIELSITSTDDATVLVEDLPAGTYAVSVFQDLNGNNDIDTNFIGIPKEPYGFSGPMGKFGPPKFDKASTTLEPGSTKQIAIELT